MDMYGYVGDWVTGWMGMDGHGWLDICRWMGMDGWISVGGWAWVDGYL